MLYWFFELIIIIVVADIVISYIPQWHHYSLVKQLRQFVDVLLRPIREVLNKLFQNNLPFDFSPIILILILRLLMAMF